MKRILLVIALALLPTLALAQSNQRNPCFGTGSIGNCIPVTTSNPLPISGVSSIATYSAAVISLANTGAGDIYCINASATKTVKIKGIRVSAIATASIVGDISITLRSTLDTNGGLASVAVVAMDQTNPIGTATVNSFTSTPTTGTSIGVIRSRKIAVSTAGNAATTSEGLFQFSVYYDQPIVLQKGSTQQACVTTSAFGAGATWDIDHEHTEE